MWIVVISECEHTHRYVLWEDVLPQHYTGSMLHNNCNNLQTTLQPMIMSDPLSHNSVIILPDISSFYWKLIIINMNSSVKLLVFVFNQHFAPLDNRRLTSVNHCKWFLEIRPTLVGFNTFSFRCVCASKIHYVTFLTHIFEFWR